MAKTTDAPAKPRSDAYTGILFISLLALIGACVLLYLDYSQYDSRTPPKAAPLEVPKGGGGTGTAPKVPAKVDPMPMTKAPIEKPVETTAIRPMIETPPAPPASIPMLELPGLAPAPVTNGDRNVLPAKFEVVEPTPSKPMHPLVAPEPVKPNPSQPIIIEDSRPMPAKAPIAAPTLDEPPPVIRPFVPNK